MNGLDIVILVVFFASLLIGAMRGFTKELLSLFSWGGAISLAYVLLPLGRELVSPYIVNPMMADGAALFCTFVLSLILLSIIASIIAGYIHESSFRGVDHSLGFGFGMLRGVVVICTAELIFSVFSPRHSQAAIFQHARFIPMVRKGADTILQFLPSSLRTMILEQAIKVENQLSGKIQDQLKNAAPNGLPEGIKGALGGGIGGGVENTLGRAGSGGYPGGYPGGQPGGNQVQGQDYDGRAQTYHYPPANYPPSGQPPSPNMPPQGYGQGMAQPQMVQPQALQQQGEPVQSGMAVVRPPQPDQASQQMGGQVAPPSQGLAQSAVPQDTQTTVEQLALLTPQSAPTEDKGYTRDQRADMNRLFQAADGE